MHISIRNGGSRRKLFIESTLWALEKYGVSKRAMRDVELEISFVKDLNKDHGMFGGASPAGTDDGKSWEVEIDADLDLITTLSTLFHELCHIKQFIKRELRESVRYKKMMFWKGEYYEYESTAHSLDQPWEVEAYGSERLMLHCWMDEFKNKFPRHVSFVKKQAKLKLV